MGERCARYIRAAGRTTSPLVCSRSPWFAPRPRHAMAPVVPSSSSPPPPPTRRVLDAHERLVVALVGVAVVALGVALFTLPAPGDQRVAAVPTIAVAMRDSAAERAAAADAARANDERVAVMRADSLRTDSLRRIARADSIKAAKLKAKSTVVAKVEKPAVAPAKATPKPPATKSTRARTSECEARVAAEVWSDAFAPCNDEAARGVTLAQRRVAVMYLNGRGVARDESQATHWFSEAANGGDVESMYQFAVSLEKGRGIKKDQSSALRWYTRAGDGGNAAAQYAVAQAYEKGRLGADKNRSQALEWYRKAAAQDYGDAHNKVRELTK